MESFKEYLNAFWLLIKDHTYDIIIAIVILIIGLWIIKKVTKTIRKVMTVRSIDPSLIPFLSGIISVMLKVALFISIMEIVGVAATSFVAILGAAGLAVGMALSGTLQNFAGGVMILLLKPYKVGDVIEANGYIGTVSEIRIFNTIMKTWDNKTIIVPNTQLANNSMINYTTEPVRKIEWIFGIGYNDSIDKAREIIKSVVHSDARVIDDAPFINISELGDSSVNFKVRASVKNEDYWDVTFAIQEKVKKAFDAEGISIPFPQRDVHIHNVK